MARSTLDSRLKQYPVLERLIHVFVDQIDAKDWVAAFNAAYKLTMYVWYTSKKRGEQRSDECD